MCSPCPPPRTSADCRCACGSLLARLVAGGVELKCRRCKRTHFVPFAPPAGRPPGPPAPVRPAAPAAAPRGARR